MKKIAIGAAAVALLFFAQPGTAVSGPGGGKGGFKFGGHGHHHAMSKGPWWWKNNNNNWWYAMNNGQIWWQNNKWWYAGYGGYGSVYASQPAVAETVGVPVPIVVEAARPCQRVQQPMTVRSEDGGERVISVTRCQN
jgi:hypothetical protein